MESKGIIAGTFENELQRAKDYRRSLFPKKLPTYRILDWSFYPTLCEIYMWMDSIIKNSARVVTGFDIGRSYEGRLIRGLRLSFKPGRKTIFIESNIHAREWITSAACTYLIMELLYSRDPDVRELAESVDWWIIPVLNVDGFVYSHEKERLWRKSRRPADPHCMGIDLNRNFNYKWSLRRCADPCSNVYSGPYPESEPEVQQLVEFINNNIPEGSIKIYVALHSAAQAVLVPWTHTKVPPQSYATLMYVAKAFVEALYPRYHTKYRCGSSANILKMFTGGSKDWAYAVKHVPIAFTIELPGRGTPKRFELPETTITHVGAELLDGFRGMIKAVKLLGYI
ncbi:zinc carboxypeptidase-like [Glossina fuscipes]|uniref:Zinc carboxypeptidase-like n=1 Tax=Glossina fuscipes TaxID=7396 RepID=A0A8U0WAI6_9MUSC|nr:zinc carboxypeptidase-like [Glossina fuscipes]